VLIIELGDHYVCSSDGEYSSTTSSVFMMFVYVNADKISTDLGVDVKCACGRNGDQHRARCRCVHVKEEKISTELGVDVKCACECN
jgi:hypothetical protein